MIILKVVGVGMIGMCAVLFLRTVIPSLALLAAAGCGVIIFAICASQMQGLIGYYYDLCVNSGYAEYFVVMLKGLGIALITQIGSDFCRDSGETVLASRIEFAGKIEILVIALPLIKSLVELSESMLME